MTPQHVLVTGGAGFIGSALVRRLVAARHRVRVLDDVSRGRAARLADVASRIDLRVGDIRDAATVEAACEGVDAVFHLAAVNGTRAFYATPDVVLEVGAKGTLNVLDAAAKQRVADVLIASSSEVYQTPERVPTDESAALVIPDPLNPRYSYAGSKIIAELLALNYGRTRYGRVVVFRPHNVYGPDMGWEHVIPQLGLRARELARRDASGRITVPVQGSGHETRAFVYIDDAIDGLLVLLDRGEHLNIYHVGADRELTIAALVAEIARYFGRTAQVVPSGAVAHGGTPRRCPDISKLRALGFEPKVPLDVGLARTLRWYDEHADEAPAP